MAMAEVAMNPKAWTKSANLYSRWSLPWASVQLGSEVRADRSCDWSSFCGASMHLSYGKTVAGCRLMVRGSGVLDVYSFGGWGGGRGMGSRLRLALVCDFLFTFRAEVLEHRQALM